MADECTNANCDRRGEYLTAATDLLVSDLEWMVAQWANEGAARVEVMLNPDAGLAAILTGMGSLSYGEVAGERMPQALVGTHQRGSPISLMTASTDQIRQLDGYVGSIAYSGDGNSIAVTSPRGGVVHMYDASTRMFFRDILLTDVSGIASLEDTFVVTTGTGQLQSMTRGDSNFSGQIDVKWDNHLVAI
jgi:hypothetical protein